MDLDGCISLVQSYLQNSPLIILGSGASIPYGLPSMDTLATEICKKHANIDDEGFDDFCMKLDTGWDLERALYASSLKDDTRNIIREIVWDCVNSYDLRFFESRKTWNDFAIAKLFLKVIQPTPNRVVVVTTNYDRIANGPVKISAVGKPTNFAV